MLAFCSHGWVQKAKHSAMASTDGVATPHWHLINGAFSASNQFNWWFNLSRWWLLVIMALEFPARVTNHDLKTVWCGARSYMISCRFGRHIEGFQGIRSNFLENRSSEKDRGCSLQYLRHCQTLSSLNEVCHWGSIVMQCAGGIFVELFSWQNVWPLHSHEQGLLTWLAFPSQKVSTVSRLAQGNQLQQSSEQRNWSSGLSSETA
jgi:hypothetical protein